MDKRSGCLQLVKDMESDLIQEVNKNYRIKINGKNYIGKHISKLVGFRGLSEILEDKKLAIKICEKALASNKDIFIRKLKRGLTIRFYGK